MSNNNSGINKVILAGRILQQPRWHQNGNERILCFTLLTTENISSARGGLVHEEYHHIKIKERCPGIKNLELKKDDFLYIQGKIRTQVHVGEDQVKRYRAEIIATSLEHFETLKALTAKNPISEPNYEKH